MMRMPADTQAGPVMGNEAPTPPAEAESKVGYTMCLSCLPDGTYAFHVEPLEEEAAPTPGAGGPGPMPAMAGAEGEQEGGEAAQPVESLEQGLKLMVKYAQAHPMSGSPQTQFESGFKSQKSTQEGYL